MAIDTTNEKLALIRFQQVWQPPLPISSDGIGQDDKQSLLWGYPGILWAIPAVGEVLANIEVFASVLLGLSTSESVSMQLKTLPSVELSVDG